MSQRIAIYARVSTLHNQNPEMQLAELREYAQRRGWVIAAEYVDLGVSGAREWRPEFNRMMADAHARAFDAIACWKLDRMGRSLGFLARIVQDGWSRTPREIAIDEKSALLVEASGRAKVVGTGLGVYFLQVTDAPEVCKPGQPLTLRNVAAYRAPTGAGFDVRSWSGDGGEAFSISAEAGQIRTRRAGNAVYQ